MFLNIFNSDQLQLCMHVNIHKNQKLDPKSKNSSLAIDFNFIKEILKLYKGKYLIRAILLSFFTGKSNQLTVLTRLLHFHCFLDRHPYWPYPKPYGHMAIWRYGHIQAIWPYCFRYGQNPKIERKTQYQYVCYNFPLKCPQNSNPLRE